jgi:release factor H-coupled RctB family protein
LSSVTVFASPSSWIESDAVAQCHQVAALDGMIHVAGMPDLHPGKGAPIGAAMLSSVLYPFLVGSDIGCGIAVFPVRLKRAVPEKLAARFPDLDEPVDPAAFGLDDPIPAAWTEGLGTVGRGNHFVELARVDRARVEEPPGRLPGGKPAGAEPTGDSSPGSGAARDDDRLADGDLVLVVHSGSRGLGEQILRAHTSVHGAGPAADVAAYLAAHDEAVRWGSLNRRLLAARVASALGATLGDPVVDRCHNLVTVRPDGTFLHRKGAAPGDGGQVLVAGTRGTRSALVRTHAGAEAGWSVAHGAGRKMSRADALRRGRAKHTVDELRRTAVGSVVVCGDRQLLFEEAPTAYKRIEQVIGDLVSFGLATPVADTVPLVTYKTADARLTSRTARTARPTGARGRGGRR